MSQSRSSSLKRARSTQFHEDSSHPEDLSHPTDHSTVSKKLSTITQLLQGWSWTFPMLVKHWIHHQDGVRGQRASQKRLGIMRTLFIDNSEATYKAIKDDPVMLDVADISTKYLVQRIRAEFGKLRQSPIFGQWEADEDFKKTDLSIAGSELSKQAPLFTNIMTELAVNINSRDIQGQLYQRQEEEGYLVMLASILLLKSSRNTANRIPRMLGLYLQGTGLKRRAIEVLNGLGITECYRTMDNSKKKLVTRSEV